MLYNKKKGHASLTKKNAYTYKKYFPKQNRRHPKGAPITLYIYNKRWDKPGFAPPYHSERIASSFWASRLSMNLPLRAAEIAPVSSETTIARASHFSDTPIAER